MGLFFNSAQQGKKEAILNDIRVVNNALIRIANIFDTRGINSSSIQEVSGIMENDLSKVERINIAVRGMSDSDMSRFNVPWIDGRQIGINMWMYSCNNCCNKMTNEMENYLRSRM